MSHIHLCNFPFAQLLFTALLERDAYTLTAAIFPGSVFPTPKTDRGRYPRTVSLPVMKLMPLQLSASAFFLLSFSWYRFSLSRTESLPLRGSFPFFLLFFLRCRASCSFFSSKLSWVLSVASVAGSAEESISVSPTGGSSVKDMAGCRPQLMDRFR